jgi:hypothetical protein
MKKSKQELIASKKLKRKEIIRAAKLFNVL